MKSKRIIAFLLCFVILFSSFTVLSYADYINTPTNWWELVLHRLSNGASGSSFGGLFNALVGQVVGTVCETSSDGYHHTESLAGCELGEDMILTSCPLKNGIIGLTECLYSFLSFRFGFFLWKNNLEYAFSK